MTDPICANSQEGGEEEPFDNEIEIAISAGGGSDVVTATAWLAHTSSPKGSLIFHPGRGGKEDSTEMTKEVPDHHDPLAEGKQFYAGTDLVGRTQYLSKQLGLDFSYRFL